MHGSGDSLLAEFVSVVDAVRGLRPHAPPLTMSVVLTGNKMTYHRERDQVEYQSMDGSKMKVIDALERVGSFKNYLTGDSQS